MRLITDEQWEKIRLRLEVELHLYKAASPMDLEELSLAMAKFGTDSLLKSVLIDLGYNRKITMFANDFSQIVWRDPRESPAKVYQLEMVRYSNGIDEWGDVNPGYTVDVTTHCYCIDRTTPRGYFVAGRFVGIGWLKQSWLPSEELARKSFINLKQQHLKHLRRKISDVETALVIANNRMKRVPSSDIRC